MSNYKKFLKDVDPETFIEALNDRITELEQSIQHYEQKVYESKKKQINTKNYEQLEKVESEIFWNKHWLDREKNQLYLIDDILQKLGWSVGYKTDWKRKEK